MIDTDKYENHDMIRIAKQLLIEDAPLLLEEVKRLREALITMHHECIDFNDLGKRLHDFMVKESWKE
jgi:hypothetical protein